MDYALIIVLLIIVTALIVVLIINSRRKANSNHNTIFDAVNIIPMKYDESGIIIPIEQLPSTITIDDNKLFEITDNTVIARISAAIPSAAQLMAQNAAKNLSKQALNQLSRGDIFRVIIPSGAKLDASRQIKGAFRGSFRARDALGRAKSNIKGNANLMKLDTAGLTQASKASAVANGVANVMNVGSFVVGQYYMSEINSKIEAMSKNVSKIGDFQDRGFKSRILSLIARVGEISIFSSEILENDDLRNRKLQSLDDLKGEATQLLQHVNLDIGETIKKNQNPDYKEYQESVDSFSVLLEHQQILMSVLEEISKLTYLLGKGESSSKMCFSMFNTYLEQSNKIRATLDEWHQKRVELLGIDINKNRISKTGIGKFVAAIPGFIDDNWNYKELANGLGQKINAQRASNQLILNQPEDVYDKDVQLIIKDGKYYYLAG